MLRRKEEQIGQLADRALCALKMEQCSMHHVSLGCFCAKTGLTAEEVKDFEERGLIHGTTEETNRFYS